MFLKGTGSMVLDHIERAAYTAQSNRANAVALERFCTHFNYEPMAFAMAEAQGRPCHPTNVMLCVGSEFASNALELTDIEGRCRTCRCTQRPASPPSRRP